MVNLAMIGLCLSVRYHRSATKREYHLPSFLEGIVDLIGDFQERQWNKERLNRQKR